MSDELINKYKIAFKNKKPIKETFFQSTSFDNDKAFRGNVRFLINVKSGKKIDTYSAFKSESEVLLKRNTNYKVYDIRENGSITEIYMEEI